MRNIINLQNIKINDKLIFLNKHSKISDFILYSIDLSDFKVISKIYEEPNRPDLQFMMNKKNIINNFYNELIDLPLNFS